MNYYIYLTDDELGKESLGAFGKFILRDVKRLKQTNVYKMIQKKPCYRIYSFTNFYDENTFKLVEKKGL